MRAGVTLYFQNYPDWGRYEARERGEDVGDTPVVSDTHVWDEELRFASLVEELGFDSIWTVEHHIAPYTMIPNPLLLLAHLAGKSQKLDVGTMVIVLPWHHPLRVAEDLVLMQHMLQGRRLIVGLGRGAGVREFNALGMEMGESRERFNEAVDVIQLAIGNEYFSYEGKHYTFKDVQLRPRPRDPQAILDSLYCAWGSPDTVPHAAEKGLKPIVIPKKSWADYDEEMQVFKDVRAGADLGPSEPIVVPCTFCAPTDEEAEAGARKYMYEYQDSAARNYQLGGDHFATTKGYEHYAAQAQAQAASGRESMVDAMTQNCLDNHVWGSPETCIKKILAIADSIPPVEMVFMFHYGDMPREVAESSMRLFAKEVLPAVHEMNANGAAAETIA
jgi:alkanesulfonate monooxygenase SsuD/methylene tetrahydromethanopterin reductase-like flavin-dependent oxidoreductase (luciferase family)